MAKLLSDYIDTVDMFLKMSYEEKVSVCRESYLNILKAFSKEQTDVATAIAIIIMIGIISSDSCISEKEKQFIKDVIRMSMITDEYIEKHKYDFREIQTAREIEAAFETVSRGTKREYVTLAIGMITVDGKDSYQEKSKLKDFFNFYEVFDEVFDPLSLSY